jgi:CRP-like cAMP-binding protein
MRAFQLIKKFEDIFTNEEKVLLCYSLKVVRHLPYDPVCKIKDPSNCVFFLLQGRIAITLTNAKVYTAEVLDGTVIAYYEPGAGFGEVGILTNTSRTASCVPVTLARVMILSKGAFKALLGDKMNNERKNNFHFISSVRLFEGWPQPNIHGILTHVKILKPEINMFIYKRSDVDSNIYIIYKGEVQLLAEIVVETDTDIEKSKLMRKQPIKPTNIRSVN